MDNLSLIFLFHIMTVRDVKMFLAVSRDLSTDRNQKGEKRLDNSTLGDKSPRNNKLNQKHRYVKVETLKLYTNRYIYVYTYVHPS